MDVNQLTETITALVKYSTLSFATMNTQNCQQATVINCRAFGMKNILLDDIVWDQTSSAPFRQFACSFSTPGNIMVRDIEQRSLRQWHTLDIHLAAEIWTW